MRTILFVCVENACRSQMAEGFANDFGKGFLKAYSAGSKPSDKVDSSVVKVMKEAGIDISGAKPKSFSELPIKDFTYVISMGCRDTCPFIPAEKHIQWEIEDPKGKDINFFRKMRDEIQDHVSGLVKKISKR